MNSQIRTRSFVLVIPAGLLAPLPVHANESATDFVLTRRADGFGEARQVAVSGAASMSLERTTFAPTNGPAPGSSTSILIAPSADFFVLPRVCVPAGRGWSERCSPSRISATMFSGASSTS
jgi:hypothetical protein